VYIGSLGSTTCQIYPYTGGVKEGSYDTNHTLQLELGESAAAGTTHDARQLSYTSHLAHASYSRRALRP
jgi:hypothetical protein